MKKMFNLASGGLQEAIVSHTPFVDHCKVLKSEMDRLRSSIESYERDLKYLTINIRDGILSSMPPDFSWPLKAVFTVKRPRPGSAKAHIHTLTFSLFTNCLNSEDEISLFSAHISFDVTTPDFVLFDHRINTDIGNTESLNTVVRCVEVHPDTLIGCGMACGLFIKATMPDEKGELPPFLRQYVFTHKQLVKYEATYADAQSYYARTLMRAFRADHRTISADDLFTLWASPVGTQLHFVSLSSKTQKSESGEHELVLTATPYTLHVWGDAEDHSINYCRKNGKGGFVGVSMASLNRALKNNDKTASVFENFEKCLFVENDDQFDHIRQSPELTITL